MKRIALIFACCSLISLGITRAAEPQRAPDQQLLALVKEVQAQQIQMAENQTKIEAQLTTIAEAVRIARIYSSRGGN